ncbi:hypothetical protein ACOSQ2_011012 [Xanthoceras sorbifolium]
MPLFIPRIAGLTPAEEQLKCYLKRYDEDKDGKLRWKELRAAFHSLGLHLSCVRAARALHHADADRDGYVDEEEMIQLVKFATAKWGLSNSYVDWWIKELFDLINLLCIHLIENVYRPLRVAVMVVLERDQRNK